MSTQKEYSNENIRVELTVDKGCSVEASIFIQPSKCEKLYENAIKAISKKISIPGFRKGKAPRTVVEKNFKEAIEEQWNRELTHFAVNEALNLTNKTPWNERDLSNISMKTASREEGAQLNMHYECEPEIPTIDPKTLTLPSIEPKAITDEAIDQEILEMKKHHATYEAIEDRPAQEGDFIQLTIFSLDENPPKKLVDKQRAEVKKGVISDWILKQVIGAKAGDTKEAMSQPFEDASEEEEAKFKPTNCRIVIDTLEKQQLPDDKKMVELSSQDSLEDLRKMFKEGLGKQEESRVDRALKDEIWNLLIEEHDFDVPASLLTSEKTTLGKGKVSQLMQEGMSYDEIKKNEAEIELSSEKEARFRLKRLFLARKISHDANLYPSKEEIQQRARETLMWESLRSGQSPANKDDPALLQTHTNNAFLSLIQENSENYLLTEAGKPKGENIT